MTDLTRWLYLSDLDHLTVREWVNGLWFAVSLAMCIEFGRALFSRIRKYGADWYQDIGSKAIIALFGYFLGESLMRGWVWLLLATESSGAKEWAATLQADYYIAFVAAGISTWAALCCIFVFSRNHWAWVRAAAIIVGFVIVETVVL